MGDILLKVLILEYVVIALVYGISGDYTKTVYFIGAAILSVAVLSM